MFHQNCIKHKPLDLRGANSPISTYPEPMSVPGPEPTGILILLRRHTSTPEWDMALSKRWGIHDYIISGQIWKSGVLPSKILGHKTSNAAAQDINDYKWLVNFNFHAFEDEWFHTLQRHETRPSPSPGALFETLCCPFHHQSNFHEFPIS